MSFLNFNRSKGRSSDSSNMKKGVILVYYGGNKTPTYTYKTDNLGNDMNADSPITNNKITINGINSEKFYPVSISFWGKELNSTTAPCNDPKVFRIISSITNSSSSFKFSVNDNKTITFEITISGSIANLFALQPAITKCPDKILVGKILVLYDENDTVAGDTKESYIGVF